MTAISARRPVPMRSWAAARRRSINHHGRMASTMRANRERAGHQDDPEPLSFMYDCVWGMIYAAQVGTSSDRMQRKPISSTHSHFK